MSVYVLNFRLVIYKYLLLISYRILLRLLAIVFKERYFSDWQDDPTRIRLELVLGK
jgi:hypothetical protein